ncbi:ribosomal protein S18-alanine N-acetyltransferase [Vibrio fluvialis]|uniref:ribosomal protein S18-alanine N-acetyltransferase n=1 Tax=Vibrio fluvialis TaxID=676 RepID=UPI001ABED0DD|nr:ribosomal protein S18-alanine N-acetyltransferase [Vibrio fluvialis]QTH05292.1 ribosomal protein S18-alanine N-acetyltransferase [Vibrio fluvialis]
MTIQFMPMAPQHTQAVYQIEQRAHTHPWSANMIGDLSSRGACHYVMLVDETLVGYFYAQNIVGEVTLLNIAVDPQQQGKGYGRQLAEYFLEICEQAGAESAWLEVRESNKRAYALYSDLGFNDIDRRVNYYPTANGLEDAIIMSYLFL